MTDQNQRGWLTEISDERLRELRAGCQRVIDDIETGIATRKHFTEQASILDELLRRRASARASTDGEGWQPIETAPKGGGAEMVTDPAWVDPPEILLLFPPAKKAAAAQAVGVWDWYYAPGGGGHAGCSAWISPASGDLLAMYYGEPTHWRPLPAPPAIELAEQQSGER